jgi:hypothetical protein
MPSWLLNLVQAVFGVASGPMREQIVKNIKEWELKAKETKDPWDDILVGIVKFLLVIP